MNYNKVIKDLKERNNNLQEQYRLRDIRCIHLEYENEMLKSDFETQHELTKKYATEKENQQKEFIEMLEKEILDSKAGSSQQYYTKEHLRLFKEIIGGKE